MRKLYAYHPNLERYSESFRLIIVMPRVLDGDVARAYSLESTSSHLKIVGEAVL